jgi:high affinity Mn2+ porin
VVCCTRQTSACQGVRAGIALVALSVGLAFAGPGSARAADASVLKAKPVWAYDWTGFYVGGHVGYSRGSVDATLGGAVPTHDTAGFGALYGGVHGGYNYLLPSGMLLGVEADLSFPNFLARDDVVWWRSQAALAALREKMDFVGSLRARVGRTLNNNWLVYGTGGLAFSRGRFLQGDAGDDGAADKTLKWRAGWVVGTGLEAAINSNWTARLEYLYSRLGSASASFPSGDRYSSSFDLNTVRLGLTRKIGGDGNSARGAFAAASPSAPVDWEIHGQATYIQQGYGRFRSPYLGQNSFTPWPQTRETLTVSAFLAAKVWEGGELYYNPELLQGFGLHSTTGAAGFPNGEAQKSDFPSPHYSTSRLFLRQSWGLGGEQETIASDYGQMAGKKDISRVTVQAGRFAVHDAFDGNSYSSDPRAHFMNWALWAAGAFDYAADRAGLGYGTFAELNQKDWALRVGYFLMNKQSNSNQFDMNLGKRGEYVAEYERRYSIAAQPGKLRLIAFFNEAFSGDYRDALNLVAMNPGLDPTDAIVQTRRGRSKYGYAVNLEQAITEDLGVFGRWSWNNGKSEIMAFTDIDASLSGGAVLKGTSWSRPDDKVGLGGAVNGLSRDHRDYIAAGGLGPLIGDGALNYRYERILESYYAIALMKGATLTFDYQFLVNPAYNADRGPVSIFAGRLHTEF